MVAGCVGDEEREHAVRCNEVLLNRAGTETQRTCRRPSGHSGCHKSSVYLWTVARMRATSRFNYRFRAKVFARWMDPNDKLLPGEVPLE